MKLKEQAVQTNVENVVGRIRINRDMTAAQARAGILATATIRHPAFETRAIIGASSDGKIFVSSESTKLSDGSWFNIVSLSADMRAKIVQAYEEEIEVTPWYLEMQDKEVVEITAEAVNESLDIKGIYLNTKINQKQIDAGVVCKATLATNAGNMRGITVFKSKFGKELYLVEQENNDSKAYTVTNEAKAQILSFVHAQVEDWGEPVEEVTPVASVVETVEEQGPEFPEGIYN